MNIFDRFEAKFIPEPNSGCWLWIAGVGKDGYGGFSIKYENLQAHRVAWSLYRGPIPRGMQVLHRCDTRSCVNPDHLFLGTQADNVDDMVAKRRNSRGEHRPNSKLTWEIVRQIRASTRSNRTLAKQFGVWPGTIGKVKLQQLWPNDPMGNY